MKTSILLVLISNVYFSSGSLQGKTITISSVENEPYLFTGPNGFEGFIVDLANLLKEKLGFDYKIQLVADGRYGGYSGGAWSGMMGEVVSGDVDMAAADLTITAKREESVDFAYPFLYSGISVIYKKPIGPFVKPIETINDLAETKGVRVGVFKGGSTYHYLKKSKNPVVAKLFDAISQSGFYAKSNAEGVEAVANGDGYVAYFMETSSADYAIQKNCGLTKIGGELGHRAYGIALPLGSPYRKELNVAILQLHDEHVLEKLRLKWFEKSGEKCMEADPLGTLFSLFSTAAQITL